MVVSSSNRCSRTSWANFAMSAHPRRRSQSVRDHLDRLLDAQLIEPTEHEGLLRFRHVLVRDAAYQAQLISDRKARHLATAQVLAEAKAADPALKAFHFDHAGRPEEALVFYLQATARAKAAARSPRSSRTPLGASRCSRR